MSAADSPEGLSRSPSFIQVAKPYIFQQTIEKSVDETGVSFSKEDSVRLAGVKWIDEVRKALRLLVSNRARHVCTKLLTFQDQSELLTQHVFIITSFVSSITKGNTAMQMPRELHYSLPARSRTH